MTAFILPGTVPEDWNYVCEVSWGQEGASTSPAVGYPQSGNRKDCWNNGEAITPAAVTGELSGAGSEQNRMILSIEE